MPSDSRRLSILTVREIDDLYGLPRFTQEDRQLYFDMSAAERELANGIHTASVEAHFIAPPAAATKGSCPEVVRI
jgi:hypothetical protein